MNSGAIYLLNALLCDGYPGHHSTLSKVLHSAANFHRAYAGNPALIISKSSYSLHDKQLCYAANWNVLCNLILDFQQEKNAHPDVNLYVFHFHKNAENAPFPLASQCKSVNCYHKNTFLRNSSLPVILQRLFKHEPWEFWRHISI